MNAPENAHSPSSSRRTGNPACAGAVQPTAAVRAMGEYHPPLSGRRGLLLDFNENTSAPSPAVAACLRSIDPATLVTYPERAPVEGELAELLGLKAGQVLLTNGVDEAIHLLCAAFLQSGDEALIATPCFGMYQLFAQAAGATVVFVQPAADFRFPAAHLLKAITLRTRAIFVASPNNPTGAVARRDEILALCEAAPHAVVMVDEAYIHFGGATVLSDIEKHPNLIVARTFSKAHGLAGLRVGMLCADANTLHWVRKVASPYNVNSVALRCVIAAARDEDYVRQYAAATLRSRTALENALDALHVPRWPSAANFSLCRIGARHAVFVTEMRIGGVLVRDRSTDPGCDGCVRITAGLPEQMEQAIAAVRSALNEMRWTPEEASV